eukprot:2539229-Prymnesium_polylepis.1
MIHARSIIIIYKRARDKSSRREKRDGDGDTEGEAEMRRASATAAPRQDERAKEAMVAMPMAAKQQVIARSGGRLFGLWSFMPIRRK